MAADSGAGGRKGMVVVAAPSRVRKDRPRLIDASHSVGCLVRALVEVRVMPLRQPAMRTRHLERGGVAGDAERGVGIDRSTGMHRADSTAAARPPSV